MIFISHNYQDKPVVEQIAIRLREAFGQDRVFYDSWSIQPGDGIIDKMNQGISDCELFLFCVSKNSLQSKMVTLEWQNAVIIATQGKTKLIPIRLDDSQMPPILLQSLYIDLFSYGLEVSLRQIVDITSGNNTFRPGQHEFSNLQAYCKTVSRDIMIECRAGHYLEPVSNFLFLTKNERPEIEFRGIDESSYMSNFYEKMKLNNGQTFNGMLLGITRGTLPGFPFSTKFSPKTDKPIFIDGVMHEVKRGEWKIIPFVNEN